MMESSENSVVSPVDVPFQDIVRVRKAERKQKAEEIRQLGLQRINNMKSKSGIDPLDQFPRELWEQIFHELDPEDKASVWQIHPQFCKTLSVNRIRDILFPLALRIDEFRYAIRDPENVPKTSHSGLETCFGDDLGKLRLISKSMRNAVDHWVEDTITKSIRGTEENDRRPYPLFGVIDEEVRLKLGKILANFRGSNPAKHFFPRGMTVAIPAWGRGEIEVDDEVFRVALRNHAMQKNRITKLLKAIGDQIWKFQLVISSSNYDSLFHWGSQVNFSNAYTALQHWAHFMPNLKSLQIVIIDLQPYPIPILPTVEDVLPFPRLHSLEQVGFVFGDLNYWDQPGAMNEHIFWIHHEILTANQHIRRLDLQLGNGAMAIGEFLPHQLIKSLQLTSFNVGRYYEYEDVQLSFRQIQPMINYGWQLSTIDLNLLEEENIPLYSILRFLERFPTLENVTLDLGRRVRIGFFGDTFGFLNLPCLSQFKMTLTRPEVDFGSGSNVEWFFSLQFLLNCSKLKTLYWTLHGFNDDALRNFLKMQERNGEYINFLAGMRVLYDSNIWEIFPCLETVHVSNWKLKEDSEEVCEDGCCQEYRRGSIPEGMTVNNFLEHHSCIKSGNYQNCILMNQ